MPPSPPHLLPSDLTGDGIADLIVTSGGLGRLFIFAGGPGFAPSDTDDAHAVVEGNADCRLRGPTLWIDGDQDGSSELLVGLECSDRRELAVLAGPVSPGSHDVDELTRRFSVLPELAALPSRLARAELTGDGREDLVATFLTGTNEAGLSTGLVAVLSDLAGLEGPVEPVTIIEGEADGDHFGNTREPVPGDVTGDGVTDLLVAAHWADAIAPDSGAAYVFAGPLPAGRHQAADLAFAKIVGTFGGVLAGVGIGEGDVDIDGDLDILVGADEDPGGGAYAGRVYIFLSPIEPGIHVADYDRYVSGAPNDELGTGIDTHGDLDGDGARDLLLHGCCANAGGLRGVGVLFGVFASDPFSSRSSGDVDFTINGDAEDDHWGAARAIGDVDADGRDDFAVGLTTWSGGQGRVYVTFGRRDLPSGTASASADLLLPGPAGSLEGFGGVVGR